MEFCLSICNQDANAALQWSLHGTDRQVQRQPQLLTNSGKVWGGISDERERQTIPAICTHSCENVVSSSYDSISSDEILLFQEQQKHVLHNIMFNNMKILKMHKFFGKIIWIIWNLLPKLILNLKTFLNSASPCICPQTSRVALKVWYKEDIRTAI